MSAGRGSIRGRRLLSAGLLLLGLLVLGLTAREVDLGMAWRALVLVGAGGCAAFLLNIAITIGGPFLGWHLLMRSLAIPVSLPTTLLSGLIGRACNLLSPMSYFGGEGVRTFHVAAKTGVPRRRVLAALVVSEFQVMAGLTVFTLLGLAVSVALSTLGGARLGWALAGGGALALGLLVILGLSLGDVRPCLRILDALIRWRIFPHRLAELRSATLDLEDLIRSLFREKSGTFFLAQLLSLSSPVAQFFRPTLFFWLLSRTGSATHLPTFGELTVFFVLSQLLFMLPTTPGGVGVYEAGVIGLFRFLGWDAADGAAYGILLRLDDVVYIAAALGTGAAVGMGGKALPELPAPAPAGPEAVSSRVRVDG